jgi:YVTN family beta-propeller protein
MRIAIKTLTFTALLLAPALQAAADSTVYVPLGNAGEALVIDAARDEVVDRIPGLSNVHGLSSDTAGKYLVTGSLSASAPGAMPPKPEGMSQSEHEGHHAKPAEGHHAKLAAGAREEPPAVSLVSIVRAEDGTILRRVEVPGAVHHTAVAPDGAYAVATHHKTGAVSVIDLKTLNLQTTIRTGPMPNYAVVSPDGRRVYVSNAGNNTVSEIDTDHWIVSRNFVVGASPEHMALSHDGRRLHVNNVDDGTVSEIVLDQGRVARTFEIGGKLHGLDVSADGSTLFVSAKERNELVAIRLHTGEKQSVPLGPAPYHVTAVGGTGKLYVSSDKKPKIWVIDEQSLRVLREIPIRGVGHQMAVVQR